MKWMGAFWSRASAPSGNQVILQYGPLTTVYWWGSHFRVWPISTAVGAQVPCTTQFGYWGDYHQIKYFALQNGTDAKFMIPFSDSSQGCLTNPPWTYFANHLHVSSVGLL